MSTSKAETSGEVVPSRQGLYAVSAEVRARIEERCVDELLEGGVEDERVLSTVARIQGGVNIRGARREQARDLKQKITWEASDETDSRDTEAMAVQTILGLDQDNRALRSQLQIARSHTTMSEEELKEKLEPPKLWELTTSSSSVAGLMERVKKRAERHRAKRIK
jgi:hypothetical protein